MHGSKKGSHISIGGSVGDKQPGQGFNEGGNAAAGPSVEKHDQPKSQGRRFHGGHELGAIEIPSNIEISPRSENSGGNEGGVEPTGQKKARVLDMSTDRFER